MVTPEEFLKVLGEGDMVIFDRNAVERLGLVPADVAWLIEVGLPLEAAPFLTFGWGELRGLPTVDEHYGQPGLADARYRLIGGNSAGDPLAVDVAAGGTVVYLVHDDRFKPIFVNSSVRHLATCLAAYEKLVTDAHAANGPDALLDDNVPGSLVDRFVSSVAEVDPPALAPGRMWADEVESLRRSAAESG